MSVKTNVTAPVANDCVLPIQMERTGGLPPTTAQDNDLCDRRLLRARFRVFVAVLAVRIRMSWRNGADLPSSAEARIQSAMSVFTRRAGHWLRSEGGE